MRISIVIPMYNEKNFAERCVRLLSEMCTPEYEWELIFSNDGSKDGCQTIIQKLAETDSRLRLVDNPVNQGKGAAIRQGVAASTGDVVLYTDCDLAYGTEQIYGILTEHIRSGSDITIGSRSKHPRGYEGYTFLRKLASKIYMKILTIFAGLRVSDSQTGLKCFKGDVARTIFAECEINRFAFDLEVLLTAQKKHCTIREYPVHVFYSDEELGRTSKVNLVKDAMRMLKDLTRIKKRLRNSR